MNIQNSSGIPAASSFQEPIKAGILQKRTRRHIFKARSWQKKFCVLNDTKLYIYENEESDGQDKNCCLINLKYYDSCSIAEKRDKNNEENVFIIQQSGKLGLFDSKHKYIFCTESKEERNDWISKIKRIITDISKSSKNQRNERSRESGKRRSLTFDRLIPQAEKLKPVTKDRAKGPKGRRLPNRKSEFPERSCKAEDSVQRKAVSEIMRSPDSEDGIQNIQFMDGGASQEMLSQRSTSNENNLNNQEVTFESDETLNIPNGDTTNSSDQRESDAQKFMRELDQKWGAQLKEEQKEKTTEGAENESAAAPTAIDPIQLRQISVTSNISTNSDRTSTYQFYMLEKDLKSLKREVNSIQILKNTSKTVEKTVEGLQNTVAELQSDVKDMKSLIKDLAEKVQNLEAVQYEDDDEPETDEDTLI